MIIPHCGYAIAPFCTYSDKKQAQDDVTATTARPQDFIELSDASNKNMKKCCQ